MVHTFRERHRVPVITRFGPDQYLRTHVLANIFSPYAFPLFLCLYFYYHDSWRFEKERVIWYPKKREGQRRRLEEFFFSFVYHTVRSFFERQTTIFLTSFSTSFYFVIFFFLLPSFY